MRLGGRLVFLVKLAAFEERTWPELTASLAGTQSRTFPTHSVRARRNELGHIIVYIFMNTAPKHSFVLYLS